MRDKTQTHSALRMTRATLCAALLLLACAPSAVFAQMQTEAAATVSTPPGTVVETDERYRIGPGDVLDVRVYKRPELSRESVRVDNRGLIRMPLVDEDIVAACLTESELGRAIAALYTEYLRNPQVGVFVKEFKSTPVAVLGAVERPGRFQLERRLRLLELLSLAGGPTEHAGAKLQLVRGEPTARCNATPTKEGDGDFAADTPSGFAAFDLNATLRGEESANPYVEPGDVVSLPEADQVYVVGNVYRPSSLALKERITVSQAVAMAGGALPDSKKNRVRIVRQGQAATEIYVDLDAIARHQAEDVTLTPNDIVEVPTSTGKRIVRSLINVIAPTATQLPIRVVRGY